MASLRARRSKKFYADPGTMRDRLAVHQDPRRTRPPRAVRRRVDIDVVEVDDRPCYILRPKPGSTRTAVSVMHLHGGGFVEQPERHHWNFAGRIVDRTGAAVIMPMYPLAPDHDHTVTQAFVLRCYDTLLADIPPGSRVVVGDSAGAALASTLTRTLLDRGDPPPGSIVMSSPWLNLAVDHPMSSKIEPDDPELGIPGLRQAAHWYCGGLTTHHAAVDPLAEPLRGFPPITVFTATRDLLLPDALTLQSKAATEGVALSLHEAPGLFHNWIMQPIPEAAGALDIIADVVRGTALDHR